MKVLMAGGGTGGHLYPMLALAEALKDAQPDTQVIFVGSSDRLETRLVPEAGYPFFPIHIRPGKNPLKLARAVGQALQIARREKPDVVVGAGGYICFPSVMAAFLMGTPVVLLEQNAHPGLANQVLAPLSRLVLTSFPETHLPHAVWSGNPLRRNFLNIDRIQARQSLGLSETDRLLVVTGGSQGAMALNDLITTLLPRLLAQPHWKIFHLSGERDYARVLEANAPEKTGGRYRLEAYWNQMAELLRASDLVVSRAGASTIAELTACGAAAVLLPGAFAGGHQKANAQAMVQAGAAVVLEPGLTDPEAVWQVLEPLVTDDGKRQAMQDASLQLGRPEAAREAAQHIMALKR